MNGRVPLQPSGLRQISSSSRRLGCWAVVRAVARRARLVKRLGGRETNTPPITWFYLPARRVAWYNGVRAVHRLRVNLSTDVPALRLARPRALLAYSCFVDTYAPCRALHGCEVILWPVPPHVHCDTALALRATWQCGTRACTRCRAQTRALDAVAAAMSLVLSTRVCQANAREMLPSPRRRIIRRRGKAKTVACPPGLWGAGWYWSEHSAPGVLRGAPWRARHKYVTIPATTYTCLRMHPRAAPASSSTAKLCGSRLSLLVDAP